jgi:peptidoglycan/xylan/chitin deacetylase (PgdA/CDA1 family)
VVEHSEVVYDRKDNQVITRSHELSHVRQKSVILTFDDGPGRHLPQILDVLKKENVPALFFWQTRLLHPNRPWKRVIDEGHMIGSHSCKHPDLRRMDYNEQYNELFYSKQKLEKITEQPVRYFRPPFGQYDTRTLKAAKALDLIPVMWSTASCDWELKERPEQIIVNVVSHLEEGAIILLHELSQTLLVLPELIRQIRNKGYSFSILPA